MLADLLKAAGTPMIKPLPEANSFSKLTLVPGDVSVKSTEGIASPTLTIFALVVLKVRVLVDEVYDRRLGARMRDLIMNRMDVGRGGKMTGRML